MDDWTSYAQHTWGWKWLSGIWVQHPAIRPSDRDGFVHVGGYLMFLDGKVTAALWLLSLADERMVRKTGNTTCLYLRADPAKWDPDADDHEPQEVTHYFLKTGPWPAESWSWNRWTPTDMATVRLLCVQWATWAADLDRARGPGPLVPKPPEVTA